MKKSRYYVFAILPIVFTAFPLIVSAQRVTAPMDISQENWSCSLLLLIPSGEKVQAPAPSPHTVIDKKIQAVLDTRIEGPVEARGVDLAIVIQTLQAQSGIPMAIEQGIYKKVTFSFNNPTVQDILGCVLPANNLGYQITENGTILIRRAKDIPSSSESSIEPIDEIPEEISNALDSQIEGPVEARSVELSTIIQILQQACGLPFVLDEGVIEKKATFSFQNPTVRDVLDTVLLSCGLKYQIMENGVVLIKEIAPPSPSAALDKRFEGPFEANNVDLFSILSTFHQECGLQFVLDDGMNKKLSFCLDNPTVRDFLDTVLPSYWLDYHVLENGVIQISQANRRTRRTPKNSNSIHDIDIHSGLAFFTKNIDGQLFYGVETIVEWDTDENQGLTITAAPSGQSTNVIQKGDIIVKVNDLDLSGWEGNPNEKLQRAIQHINTLKVNGSPISYEIARKVK